MGQRSVQRSRKKLNEKNAEAIGLLFSKFTVNFVKGTKVCFHPYQLSYHVRLFGGAAKLVPISELIILGFWSNLNRIYLVVQNNVLILSLNPTLSTFTAKF